MITFLERRRAMMMEVGEIKGTSIFYCNGYDHNDYQWDSSSNLSLLNNAPSTASNYARINKSGSGTDAWIYTTFDTSSLLSNATVVYADIRIKGFSNTSSTRTVQPYCNGVAKYSPITTGNSSDLYRTIIVSKLTIEDIKGLTCKFYMVSSGTSVYYRVYGATLRVVWSTNPEYFHFQDQEVESAIADKIGNGVGITLDAMQLVTSLPVDTFRGNTDIVTFNELEDFTSLTTIGAGSSSSALGAFGGCTNLESIKFPSSLTTIGAYAFYGCSGLTTLTIPNSVTSIGNYAFSGCSGFTGSLVIPDNVTSIGTNAFALTNFTSAKLPKELPTAHNPIMIFQGNNVIKDITIGSTASINISNGTSPCGDGTGTLTVYSDAYANRNNYTGRFKNFIIHGNYKTERSGLWNNPINNTPYSFRVKNTIGSTLSSAILSYVSNSPYNASTLSFVECGNIEASNSSCLFYANSTRSRADNCILHINRSTLPTNYAANVPYYKVGLGFSRAEDEATLALYLADSNWSAQSAKLATWYDYNGEYKWYYVTDVLTNCTNTNPDAWPHITRKDEYRTTIVADDGYTLQSVQVQMYQCADDTATPNTPTDITSQVYNASTGEIYINSVMGNIIITASAS